jgi:ubiquinone biosynthesis protein
MARRLNPSWIPTPLSPDAERRPVPIAARSTSVRWRAWSISAQALSLAIVYAARLLTGTLDRAAFYARVRRAVETTGGLWIKAAQLLSLRVDILPVPLCHELASLQAHAPGFAPALAREIVERELGAPVDVFFDRWDDAPIAAASIGQVHRARLRREQTWVAVKIQKPDVASLFARDLAIVRRGAAVLTRLRLFPHMKWDDGARELRQIMKEELDFGYEASMTRRMRRLLRPHGVYVPKVFARYSTPRVLVAELIPAVFMAEYIRIGRDDPPRLERWLAENDVNPRRVGRRLAWSLHRQMLEDNLFHGDMHPGNIALLRGSRVALIDFGTTNFTDAEYLRTFDLFSRAVAAGQHAKAADMALLLCARLPVVDPQIVREHLVRVFRGWNSRTLVRALPYRDRSLNTLTLEVMGVLLGFRCHMAWAWLRLHRAIATLDASLIHLHPRIDYRRIMARYLAEADRRRRRRILTPATARRALTAVARLPDVQDRVRDYVTFQTRSIRRQAQRFRGVARRVSGATAALLGIAALAVLLQTAAALALVVRTAAGASLDAAIGSQLSAWLAGLPRLEPQAGTLVLLLDAWVLFGIHRLRRELTRRDVDLRRHAA